MPFTSPTRRSPTARTTPSTPYTTRVEPPVSGSTRPWAAGHGSISAIFEFDANTQSEDPNVSTPDKKQAHVTLSTLSRKEGRIVTADAVKVGGGMGNIARIMPEEQRNPEIDYQYEVSGYPRFTEGAKYWLQWAGFPDSVYTPTNLTSDYRDDYLCRGLWVNYLVGGSKNAPDREGMHIPIDLSFAFHTDAGTTPNDSIIGTLGIYYTHKTDGLYPNGTSRWLSRDLTDLVQTQIVSDIEALYEPNWSRRGMWNDSYFEAHVPEVPSMLLELLSHQNFADMRYGLDPSFRFTVSRAIYKGILRFLAFQNKQEYVVQPLPVDHFRIRFCAADSAELSWQPVDDPLEPTAHAERYILYTRIGDGGFDNGTIVDGTHTRVKVTPRHHTKLQDRGLEPWRREFPVRNALGLPSCKFRKRIYERKYRSDH